MKAALYGVIFVIALCQAELLSVHVVFRHGARAPVQNVTSEEAKTYFYRGLGQLTDEGIEQAKVIGQVLRDRYVGSFLDSRMVSSELLFRSSPVERCLMTMETVGKTMFPNATPPVQTVPKDDDYLLLPKMDCPFLIDEYANAFNLTAPEKEVARRNIWDISERALSREAQNTEHLKDKTKENIPALILEKEAGLAVPAWFNEEAHKEATTVFYSALAVMSSVGEYLSPRGIRPKSGQLLHKIFSDINDRVSCTQRNKTKCGPKKFQAFSSHDILILSLLESLGIREKVLGFKTPPEFLATIIFETWMIDGKPVVKVLYRKFPRETTLTVVTGGITNCPENQEYCPAELLTSCCSEFLTADAKTECLGSPNQWTMNPLSWVFLALSVIFLILIFVLSYLVIRYKNSTSLSLKV